jgi:ABC-type tungstate transport system permease subunit
MSGTDAAEQRLWTEAGGPPIAVRDLWYLQAGSGMEQTLTIAASINGYALTDRGTWAEFRDRQKPKNSRRARSSPVQPVRSHRGELGTAS